MKITEDEHELVLIDFDWWWAVGAVTSFLFLFWHVMGVTKGVILTALPLITWSLFCGSFLFLATRSKFVFDKVQQELHWERIGITGRYRGTIQFSDFRSASIRLAWPEWEMPTNRIVLTTAEGMLPIQTGFTLDSDRFLRQTLARIKAAVVNANSK